MAKKSKPVPVPSILGDLLLEAEHLSTAQIAEFRKNGEVEIYPGEMSIGKLDENFIRMFALAWHKARRGDAKFVEAKKLVETEDPDVIERLITEGGRLMAEAELVADTVRGILKIVCELWQHEPFDGGWVRSGDQYVIECLDPDADELDIEVVLEDDVEDDDGNLPGEAQRAPASPKIDRKKLH